MSIPILGLALCVAVWPLARVAQESSEVSPRSGPESLTAPARVWSFASTLGQPSVALADRGTTVLRLAASAQVKLALLSSYDADPPTPVWSISTPPGALLAIAAAEEADVYLQSDFTQTGPFKNSSTLRKYSSGSAVPDWTFDFAQQGAFLFPTIDVSRDGQTLVGLIHDEVALSHVVHVFGPSSGTPTARFALPSPHWGNSDLDLSADGSIVAFVTPAAGSSVPARTHVIDLATQSLLASVLGKLPVGGDGVSADGRSLVVLRTDPGSSNHVVVHQRSTGGYLPVLDVALPAEVVPGDAALSEDGSVLAVALWDSQNDRSRAYVRAFDVTSGVQTMRSALGGAASLANYPTDVSISADGSRFAVGCWGDGSTTSPELAIFAPDLEMPLFEFPFGGSIFSVDLSADGQRVAVGRLPNGKHANVGYTDTVTELYDLGGRDLTLVGKPSLGATVTLELHAQPGAEAFLLAATALAPRPTLVLGAGCLALDRGTTRRSRLGVVPSSGILHARLTLPSASSLAGLQVYYQALTVQPTTLSSSWMPVTLLP